MRELIFQNGCFRVELLVRDDGTISIGTMVETSSGVKGSYVALSEAQAASLVRHLCDFVPGFAQRISRMCESGVICVTEA